MQIYSTMASVLTVISFFVFVGIVFWAYSKGRQKAFDQAALEPFALPDEREATHETNDSRSGTAYPTQLGAQR